MPIIKMKPGQYGDYIINTSEVELMPMKGIWETFSSVGNTQEWNKHNLNYKCENYETPNFYQVLYRYTTDVLNDNFYCIPLTRKNDEYNVSFLIVINPKIFSSADSNGALEYVDVVRYKKYNDLQGISPFWLIDDSALRYFGTNNLKLVGKTDCIIPWIGDGNVDDELNDIMETHLIAMPFMYTRRAGTEYTFPAKVTSARANWRDYAVEVEEIGVDINNSPCDLDTAGYGTMGLRNAVASAILAKNAPVEWGGEENTHMINTNDLQSYANAFTNMYKLNMESLRALHKEMWDKSVWDGFVEWWGGNSKGEALISLKVVYGIKEMVTIQTDTIKFGNLEVDVNCSRFQAQYNTIRFGTIKIPRVTNTPLDFESNVVIYLPFIGARQLPAPLVVGRSITLMYNIDIVSGMCVAQVVVNDEKKTVVGYYEGVCSQDIPWTASDARKQASTTVTAVAATAVGAFTGGAGAAAAAGVGGAGAVVGAGKDIKASGYGGGLAGVLTYRTPFITVTTKNRFKKDSRLDASVGWPDNSRVQIGSSRGYAEFKNVALRSKANETEQSEIVKLLESGVIL